jgi:S-formylglutathione hydrolase
VSALQLQAEHACFGGVQRFYTHASTAIGLPMRFSVFLPPQANLRAVPALLYLAGLTCTEETFPMKAGAQRAAALAGLALISPDTSPRGAGITGESDSWDFGLGAGFYLDATEATLCKICSVTLRTCRLISRALASPGTLWAGMAHSPWR